MSESGFVVCMGQCVGKEKSKCSSESREPNAQVHLNQSNNLRSTSSQEVRNNISSLNTMNEGDSPSKVITTTRIYKSHGSPGKVVVSYTSQSSSKDSEETQAVINKSEASTRLKTSSCTTSKNESQMTNKKTEIMANVNSFQRIPQEQVAIKMATSEKLDSMNSGLTKYQEMVRKMENSFNSEESSENFKTVTKIHPSDSLSKSLATTRTIVSREGKISEEGGKKLLMTSKTINITPEAAEVHDKTENKIVLNKTGNKEVTHKFNDIHFLSDNERVTEKRIDVETKKVFKNGKWLEEMTRTETLTNEKGTTTKSKKTTFRDLPSSEISSPVRERSSPTPSESTTKGSPTPPPAAVTVAASKKPLRVTRRVQQQPTVKDDLESFARQVLVTTNSYRKVHGAPPLQLSDKLSKMAKEWAEKLSKVEKMEHGEKKNIGENIYCKTSSQPWFEMKGDEVVENWYNEVEDHNYNEEPTQGFLKTGHFTQLVWKDTKEMGVAFARNKNGHMAFVVAYFSPKGNWIGEFVEKVLPPGGISQTNKTQSSAKNSAGNTAINKPRTTVDSPTSYQDRNKATSPTGSQFRNTTGSPTSYQLRTSVESPTIYLSKSIVGTPTSIQSRSTVESPTSYLSRNIVESPTSYKSRTIVGGPASQTFINKVDSPSSQISRNSVDSPVGYTARNTIPSPSESQTHKPFSSPKKQVSKSATTMKSMAEENFYEDCLNAHNYYRKKHGVQPLRLSEKLTKYSQEWADLLGKRDKMGHRNDSDYGENIYMKWSPNPNYKIPGEEAVDSWYEEINEYDFGKEPLDLGSGHFTQVVWAESKELGVGVARSNSNKIYVVANYNPPGNYIGQFSKQVPPPL